ncbi:hypothetical protein HYDPIDRAFT_168706 [Hydnomerulius pinastri MD-312]|uniref:DUF6532 domain-containing protein n=1 Tax=Hydnomerulius pinastri MD-312 TaxID=994086 RepID=A0A0C9VBW6_9AGAM|nr:hypothetical protein HYDPIDRAFT_168706 [Hydnomerulius pinastri MD-312]
MIILRVPPILIVAISSESHVQDWTTPRTTETDVNDSEQMPDFRTLPISTLIQSRPLTVTPVDGGRTRRPRAIASVAQDSPLKATPPGKENQPMVTETDTSRKRSSTSAELSDDDVEAATRPQQRPRTAKRTSTKVKEEDLDSPTELRICKRAYIIHRVLIATEIPMPNAETHESEAIAMRSYYHALKELADELRPELVQRDSTDRGKLITLAKDLIGVMYGIKTPSADSEGGMEAINRKRKLIEALLERDAFVYKNPLERSGGMYCHPIILELICRIWFADKDRSDGIRFADTHFNVDGKGIPFTTIALVVAAVRCALDEWASGVHTSVAFHCNKYLAFYKAQINSLLDWERYTDDSGSKLTARFRVHLYEKARAYAGVSLFATPQAISLGVDDFAANESEMDF